MKHNASVHKIEPKHPLKERLERNLLIAAKLMKQWAGSEFESDAIRIYERLEIELASFENSQSVKQRALARLKAVQPKTH
jgi:hypothetical protein